MYGENPWSVDVGNYATYSVWPVATEEALPKEGDTLDCILSDLIHRVYLELYSLVAADTNDLSVPHSSPKTREEDNLQPREGVSRRGLRITGFYVGDHCPVFPSSEFNSVCGKLAVLYPISAVKIQEKLSERLDVSDWKSIKAYNLTLNWLRESFGEESSEAPRAIDSTCNNCARVLKVHNFRIRCAECPDFDLCERCFTEGAQTDTHLKTHRYIPIGSLNVPLFADPTSLLEWSGSEDAILLEAVGKYGFGNWGEVAEWVAAVTPEGFAPKDKDVCRKRYFDFHMSNKHVNQSTWSYQNIKTRPIYDGAAAYYQALVKHVLPPTPKTTSVDYSPHYDAKGQDMVYSSWQRPVVDRRPLPPPPAPGVEWEAPQTEVTIYYQATKPPNALPPRVSIVGYLSNRGDFDTEWDNNAELQICDLEIKEHETPMEKEAKLRALEAYNTTLDDRWIRKRLYLDRNIHDVKFINAKMAKAQELKDMSETFRQLWRYIWLNHSEYPAALFNKGQQYHEAVSGVLASDLDDLPDYIGDDKLLVERLDLLSEWKEQGMHTLEEVLNQGRNVAQTVGQRPDKFWSVALESCGCGSASEWLRHSLSLKDQTYGQLVEVIGKQLQESFGPNAVRKVVGPGSATQMVDFIVDAQAEKLADTGVAKSPSDFFDLAEEEVPVQHTTGLVIPKKRRVAAQGEEGEIVG